MARVFFIFLFCTLSSFIFAGSITYERANQAYHNQDYAGANELYMQMIHEGVINGSVYYNAGNSFFHLKKYGRAIWAYKKALQYEPTNHLYIENFLIAKSKIGKSSLEQTPNTALNWWQKIVQHFLLEQWAWIAFVFFSIGAFVWGMRKIFVWPAITIAIPKICWWLFGFALVCGIGNYFNSKFCQYGIIVSNTQLFSGAKESGGITTSKTEGIQVKIQDKEWNAATKTNRILIGLPNGNCYWINESDLMKL
jgi:hypothetical protein